MTESRRLWECPELQNPGNRVEVNGTSRTVWRSQNRNKGSDTGQDRGNWQRCFGTVGWEWLGSCKTGMTDVRSSGCEMNELLQIRSQIVVSGGVKWLQTALYYGYWSGVAGSQNVHCKFWETSSLLADSSFHFPVMLIIRMVSSLLESVFHLSHALHSKTLSLFAFSCRIHNFQGHQYIENLERGMKKSRNLSEFSNCSYFHH